MAKPRSSSSSQRRDQPKKTKKSKGGQSSSEGVAGALLKVAVQWTFWQYLTHGGHVIPKL